jgi:NADH-quinone oxidoreductase subunit L
VNALSLLWMVPALPLLGAIVNGLGAGKLPRRLVSAIGTGTVGLAFLITAACFLALLKLPPEERVFVQQLYSWIDSADLSVPVRFAMDPLSAVMMLVVTGVGFLIHVYSTGYMGHEKAYGRYFAYLNLFTFAMLVLVMADNFLVMFLGWEGVGLCSYLLIGFWYERPSAAAAGKKAFVVNRIGDWGFLIGMLLIFVAFGTLDFGRVFSEAPDRLAFGSATAAAIALFLFIGAAGKSAQIPLHVWLPDAMEGPTPVSALIHAATMVTAGVFMVARLSPLFDLAPQAQSFVIFIGGTTAFFAGTIGVVQNDIKRIVAYSTCSQLGYMFVAMGTGAYSIGMFHLFTHAFFKALLFLCCGSVITAMHHEQDIRHMGGLKDKLPITYWTMVIGALALTGFPLTAGYFSKDAIIEAAYVSTNPMALYGFGTTAIATALTAIYIWRLIFMTFHGSPRDRRHYDEARESPITMLIPLGFLAAGSIFAGYPFRDLFAGHAVSEFFGDSLKFAASNHILEDMHHIPPVVALAPTLLMALGFAITWEFYIRRPELPAELARQQQPLYKFLLNKWYFDEIYDFLFVRPTLWLARALWKYGDGWTIDGLGPDGISARVLDVTRGVVRLQTGYLYHYAFAMLIGVAALITWFMFGARAG